MTEVIPIFTNMERVLKKEILRLQDENKELAMKVLVMESQQREKDNEKDNEKGSCDNVQG